MVAPFPSASSELFLGLSTSFSYASGFFLTVRDVGGQGRLFDPPLGLDLESQKATVPDHALYGPGMETQEIRNLFDRVEFLRFSHHDGEGYGHWASSVNTLLNLEISQRVHSPLTKASGGGIFSPWLGKSFPTGMISIALTSLHQIGWATWPRSTDGRTKSEIDCRP